MTTWNPGHSHINGFTLVTRRGSACPSAKLTEDQVRAIRVGGKSDGWFARKFGVSVTAVRKVRLGCHWRHV